MKKSLAHKMQPVKVFDKTGKLLGVATTRKEFAAIVAKLPAMKQLPKKIFEQDGRDFYDATTGQKIWCAGKIVQNDYDMEGAIAARRLFRSLHQEYQPSLVA